MRRSFPVLGAAALAMVCLVTPSRADAPVPWDKAKADHRVLVVRSVSAQDPRLADQRRRWLEQREGLAVRDVVVWEWIGDGDVRRWPDGVRLDVRDRLASLDSALAGAAWRVMLLGRDGEAKAAWDGVVEPSEVFGLIDAMPMGRREKAAREAGDVRP